MLSVPYYASTSGNDDEKKMSGGFSSSNSVDALVMFVVYCVVYAAIEFAYLSRDATMARYRQNFARVQNVDVRDVDFRMWPYGILSYVVLFVTVWYFVIRHVVRRCGSAAVEEPPHFLYKMLGRATMLALAIYGVYNLTNAATLSGYDTEVVALDTLWGVFAINAVMLVMWALCYAIRFASRFSSGFDKNLRNDV